MQDQITYKKLNQEQHPECLIPVSGFDHHNMHLVFVYLSGKISKATEDPKSSQMESGIQFSFSLKT